MKKQGLAVTFTGTLALLVLLSMTAMASTGRYDQQIQQTVSQKIHDAKQLQSVSSSVEDGIVTLTGTVGLYQDKLDAAKKIGKLDVDLVGNRPYAGHTFCGAHCVPFFEIAGDFAIERDGSLSH